MVRRALQQWRKLPVATLTEPYITNSLKRWRHTYETSDCAPTVTHLPIHTVLDPSGASCLRWTHKGEDRCPGFGLGPTEPHPHGPDHQVLASQPHPQAWHQSGDPVTLWAEVISTALCLALHPGPIFHRRPYQGRHAPDNQLLGSTRHSNSSTRVRLVNID